jgi:multimeric flavodoxin WrbA
VKAIAICGSPRKNGNTEILARHTLDAIETEGLTTELISLAGTNIKPCTACMVCSKEEQCPIEDDLFPIYHKMKDADAIILASPVYFGSATGQIKSLMDRTGYIANYNNRAFEGKVGGSLVVARRAGKNFTFAQLNYWFQILGFYMTGSTYWNVAFGRQKGEVTQDEEGLVTAYNFGKNVAFLVQKIRI